MLKKLIMGTVIGIGILALLAMVFIPPAISAQYLSRFEADKQAAWWGIYILSFIVWNYILGLAYIMYENGKPLDFGSPGL